jgi:hypothetical protein
MRKWWNSWSEDLAVGFMYSILLAFAIALGTSVSGWFSKWL